MLAWMASTMKDNGVIGSIGLAPSAELQHHGDAVHPARRAPARHQFRRQLEPTMRETVWRAPRHRPEAAAAQGDGAHHPVRQLPAVFDDFINAKVTPPRRRGPRRVSPRGAARRPAASRVLLVDDSRFVRTTFARILKASSRCARKPTARRRGARSTPIRSIVMVFTDLDMPKLDGFGLLERIRSSPTTRASSSCRWW